MIYKQYGATGARVSAVGFGGMRFDTSRPQAENAELLHYAQSLGVNYFDTAPGYCADQSEDIFGLALREMTGEFFVSTKGMPMQFDTAQKAYDQVRRSLDRLHVPKIDFYHVWCLRKMEHYACAMAEGAQYDGLMRAKEEGLVDHIVFSSHQPGGQIKSILDEGKMEGVLLGMNILNFPYRWAGVQAAYEAGYGVVAMNPLAGGVIPQHEDKLAFLAGEGETPTEAALRFLISCPQITVTLPGFTTKAHIDMACRAADRAVPFTAEDIARIQAQLTTNYDAICTSCGYCDDCPQGIPIPSYMHYYNDKLMFGVSDEKMAEGMKHHLSWGNIVNPTAHAKACTECGRCEEECTQHLPITARLAEMAAWEEQIGA